MSKRPRKPGDQAPPARPVHRNRGKTATTHVREPRGGKIYRVEDGDGALITLNDQGATATGLSYKDAMRLKSYAVSRLKMRRATVVEDTGAPAADADPELARLRQLATDAARPAAQAAQARVDQRSRLRAVPPAIQTPPVRDVDLPFDSSEEFVATAEEIAEIEGAELALGIDLDDMAEVAE